MKFLTPFLCTLFSMAAQATAPNPPLSCEVPIVNTYEWGSDVISVSVNCDGYAANGQIPPQTAMTSIEVRVLNSDSTKTYTILTPDFKAEDLVLNADTNIYPYLQKQLANEMKSAVDVIDITRVHFAPGTQVFTDATFKQAMSPLDYNPDMKCHYAIVSPSSVSARCEGYSGVGYLLPTAVPVTMTFKTSESKFVKIKNAGFSLEDITGSGKPYIASEVKRIVGHHVDWHLVSFTASKSEPVYAKDDLKDAKANPYGFDTPSLNDQREEEQTLELQKKYGLPHDPDQLNEELTVLDFYLSRCTGALNIKLTDDELVITRTLPRHGETMSSFDNQSVISALLRNWRIDPKKAREGLVLNVTKGQVTKVALASP